MPPKKKRGGKAAGPSISETRRTSVNAPSVADLDPLDEARIKGDDKKKRRERERLEEWNTATPPAEDWSGGVLGLSARTSRASSALSKGKGKEVVELIETRPGSRVLSPLRSPARSISNTNGGPGNAGGWVRPSPARTGQWAREHAEEGWEEPPASSEAGAWPSIMGGRSVAGGWEGPIAMPLPPKPSSPAARSPSIHMPTPTLPVAAPPVSPRPPSKHSASSSGSSKRSFPAAPSIGQNQMFIGGHGPGPGSPPIIVEAPAQGNSVHTSTPSMPVPQLAPGLSTPRSPGTRPMSSASSRSTAMAMPSPDRHSIQMPHPELYRQSIQHTLSAHHEQEEEELGEQGFDRGTPKFPQPGGAASNGLPRAGHSVLRRTSRLSPLRMPLAFDAARSHSTAYQLAVADPNGSRGIPGAILTHNMRIIESGGLALKGAERAMFGSHRHASQRFFWTLPPEHDENVIGLLNWVVAMSWGLGDLGLRKFLSWRDRGALLVNADFRPWNSPEEPAFDWLPFQDAQKTRDRILQESIASYDPATTVLVFAFLVSESGSSLGIWRRKVSIPISLQVRYANQINRIKKEIEKTKPPVVKIEKEFNTAAPISLYSPARAPPAEPHPPRVPSARFKKKPRKHWWQVWKKKPKAKP